jgi:predicted PurR-regulated permease PerM
VAASLIANPTSLAGRSIPFLTVVGTVVVLYVAQDFFLPLALAILISFLLAPVIRRLERWRLGRVPSVIVATLLAFTVIGGIGYTIAGQIIDLAKTLPTYKSNLHAKIVSLKTPPDSPWSQATRTLRELSVEFTRPDHARPEEVVPVLTTTKPVPVEVVYTPINAWETLKTFAAPIAAPLGTAAIVVVLVIFMLLGREDLRDRMIHLVGRGRLHVTTQALDEAGERVSRYLVAQCFVNVTYGIPIGVGLWLIGIPNAVLWGLLAAILRFVPYIGPWIAAAFPLALSLAVAPSWNAPLLTLGLFLVVELISNNLVEPWLYGSSTGLSPMAVIVSAIFWAWLWGPLGLLLATPLTVCIVVVGKYIPSLSFLEVLLGDRPPIAQSDRLYQRLLALDSEEVASLCEDYTAEHSLAETFDDAIIPAIQLVEAEYREQQLDEAARKEIHRVLREIINNLGEDELAKAGTKPAAPPDDNVCVLLLPASSESDELGTLMLAQLLTLGGLRAELVSSKALAGEMIERAAELRPKLLCISAVPPGSVLASQHLCRRLSERLGKDTRMNIGLWNEAPDDHARRLERFQRARADQVFIKLAEAAREILLQAGSAPAGKSGVMS